MLERQRPEAAKRGCRGGPAEHAAADFRRDRAREPRARRPASSPPGPRRHRMSRPMRGPPSSALYQRGIRE